MPSDTKMLDWMEDQCDSALHNLINDWDSHGTGESLRETIAAAMAESEGGGDE